MKKAVIYELKDYRERVKEEEVIDIPDMSVSSLESWLEQVKFER